MNREKAKQRAEELVSKMTIEEACSQLRYDSPAIDRLGIPEYNWWNETLHGVARAGTATSFPQAIGLGATFDTELLGEVVTTSTKKNLQLRVDAENGATAGKTDLAKRAKAANLDAIHDTVHEMARDEARHGKAFEGLLKRYFS